MNCYYNVAFLLLFINQINVIQSNDYGSSIKTHPNDVTVSENSNTTLTCEFHGPVYNCEWIKDSCCKLEYHDRYVLVGNPENGNCTIEIRNVQMGDSGLWQCLTSKPSKSYSNPARVTVRVNSENYFSNTNIPFQFVDMPVNKTIVRGKDLFLECQFNQAAPFCYWLKDDDPVIISGRYQFAGNRNWGNCSIIIKNISISDIGFWQCGYPKTDDTSMALKSRKANITIGVPPEDPLLVYNGIERKNGSTLYLNYLQLNPTADENYHNYDGSYYNRRDGYRAEYNAENRKLLLCCYSKNSNPPAKLEWKLRRDIENTYTLSGEPLNIIYTETNREAKKKNKLWTTISCIGVARNVYETWDENLIICEATHPLNQNAKHVSIKLSL